MSSDLKHDAWLSRSFLSLLQAYFSVTHAGRALKVFKSIVFTSKKSKFNQKVDFHIPLVHCNIF